MWAEYRTISATIRGVAAGQGSEVNLFEVGYECLIARVTYTPSEDMVCPPERTRFLRLIRRPKGYPAEAEIMVAELSVSSANVALTTGEEEILPMMFRSNSHVLESAISLQLFVFADC